MRLLAPWLLLSLLLCGNLHAQSRKERKDAKKFVRNLQGSVQDGDFTDRVHFYNLHGLIVVKVMIHGKEYTFIYDTGAATILSDDLVNELGLKPEDDKIKSFAVDAYNNRREQKRYKIDELKLGNTSFYNTSCYAADLSVIKNVTCMKVDGLFGSNIMCTCFWKINMQDTTLEFSNKLPAIPSNAVGLDFKEAMGHSIFLEMSYADTTIDAEFDCGNNKPFTISDSLFFRSADYKTGHFVHSTGNVGVSLYETNISQSYRTVSAIELDGQKFNDVVLEAQPSSQILIGSPFIRDKETILDWKHHKIYFAHLSGPLTGIDPRYGLGIGLTVRDNKLKVAHLWQASSAEKAGIQLGDEVVNVNGTDTRNATQDTYCSIMESQMADQMTLTVRHASGQEKTVTIHREALIK